MQYLDLIPKLTRLMSTIMQRMGCPWKRWLAKDGWFFKTLVVLQQSTGRPRRNKHNSNEWGIPKSQWRGQNYPLTVKEIIEAQKADNKLKHFFKHNATLDKGLELQIIEDQKCICNKGRLVIPTPLQQQATMWYPPLSSAPGAHPSRRNNERHNILERNEKNHPVHHQILQVMPSQQKTYTKIWPPAI